MELERTLIGFDIETTGLDLAHDRIIELGIVYLGKEENYIFRFNPGRSISEEATAVHGIKAEDLKNEPTFEEKAHEIYALFEDCDIFGFNIERFDIPILVEEFLRFGYEFPAEGVRIIDAHKIFKKMEPRDLSAAYKFFCNKEMDDKEKHGANYDAQITLEVLKGQLERYNLKTTDELAEASKYDGELQVVDFAGKLAYREDGEIIYNIGPAKGNTIKEDLGFGNWLLKQLWLTKDTRRKLKKAME